MIEAIIAVIFIIAGIFTQNTSYFIASGLFAIAGNLYRNKED